LNSSSTGPAPKAIVLPNKELDLHEHQRLIWCKIKDWLAMALEKKLIIDHPKVRNNSMAIIEFTHDKTTKNREIALIYTTFLIFF